MRDIHAALDMIITHVTAVQSADANGSGVDRQGYHAIEHVVVMGNSGDTLSGSVFVDLRLQDSPDDSVWSDVTDANFVLDGSDENVSFIASGTGIFATIDAPAEDSRVFHIGYRGPQRYSRVVYDITGTHTNGTPVGMMAIRSKASSQPVSDDGV